MGIPWGYNSLILTFDPNFQADILVVDFWYFGLRPCRRWPNLVPNQEMSDIEILENICRGFSFFKTSNNKYLYFFTVLSPQNSEKNNNLNAYHPTKKSRKKHLAPFHQVPASPKKFSPPKRVRRFCPVQRVESPKESFLGPVGSSCCGSNVRDRKKKCC